MMARAGKDVGVQIRLLASTNSRLRRHVSKKGDIKEHVLAMLETVDLNKCPVPNLSQPKYGRVGYKLTTVLLPEEIYEWVGKSAKDRGCSINALWNGGIAAYIKMIAG